MQIFDFNKENLEIDYFDGSPIFTIKNFYKNPDMVIQTIESVEPKLWKSWETPSNNGVKFFDQRHEFEFDGVEQVSNFLSSICNQPVSEKNLVLTNKIKFEDYEFNDYFNYYWAPHYDLGYTALIYLNRHGQTGTNLYKCTGIDNWTTPEHHEPWRPKSEYTVIKKLSAEFNKLIMFNGKKFLHGMSIEDDSFFKHDRLNQVLFFIENQ